jgi:Permuted papain-like amidase enzyme, YaeF/YiiX, C92 family
MKNYFNLLRLMVVSLFMVAIATLSGCKNENVESVDSMFQKFSQQENFWTDEKMQLLIKSDKLGDSPENAVVSLLFRKDGSLFSSEDLDNGMQPDIRYYTDLSTFKKITNMSTATKDYARIMPLSEDNGVYLFDPYVRFFEKTQDIESNVENIIESIGNKESKSALRVSAGCPNNFTQIGDVVYAQWSGLRSVSNYVGHTGGVVSIPSYCAQNNASNVMGTTTVEATEQGKPVIQRKMSSNGSDFWMSSTARNRIVMRSSKALSNANIQAIVNYQNKQLGKTYSFSYAKYSEDVWYCSKLQWRAYYNVGINIDSDGGDFVFPNDILTDSDMKPVYTW